MHVHAAGTCTLQGDLLALGDLIAIAGPPAALGALTEAAGRLRFGFDTMAVSSTLSSAPAIVVLSKKDGKLPAANLI